ncbi:MAG: flagellar biosynthetic protein FliR [Deltaproteobacteria bacterium]|nr:flagellar biosynthetic protein FliR [Deltaproteobacteria bacterium]
MYTLSFEIPVIALSLVSLRIAGLAISAPFLNHRGLPRRIRGAFVIVLSFFFIHYIDIPIGIDQPLLLVAAGAGEFITGLAMGTILNMVVASVSAAGQLMAMEMGFAFSNMVDPSTGEQSTVIQRFFALFLILMFLLFDGHIELVSLLAYSFKTSPVAMAFTGPSTWKAIAGMGSLLFETAFRLALPLTGAILLTQVAIALAAKMAPRLNVFILGFAIMILIGLLMLPAMLPGVTDFFRTMMENALKMAQNVNK